ncbi:hypothetical protein BJX99DRAFT_265715 [Aspergillus californicus]
MSIQLGGLESYSDTLWARLPDDEIAFKRAKETPMSEETFNAIGQIFVKNNVQHRIMLYLSHRHFELSSGESVVEYGNVATPWMLKTCPESIKAGISGRTWAFFDGDLRPTEFVYDPSGQDSSTAAVVPAEFVEELGAFLREHNLEDRFGLTTCSDEEIKNPEAMKSMYETTMGRVSVMVPKEEDFQRDVVNVAWKFDGEGSRVSRDCFRCCRTHF